MKRMISCNRVWRQCFILGIGPAWDSSDGSACLILQLGFWVVVVGPHTSPIYTPSGESNHD